MPGTKIVCGLFTKIMGYRQLEMCLDELRALLQSVGQAVDSEQTALTSPVG
jgi:hypothetical protein